VRPLRLHPLAPARQGGAAVRLVGERQLGLEEAAAATAALFLDGARSR
jgi:hypothetical protein